ncbi:PAS domain S-box protein [Natrarchaeobius oligotrophus]|uniref:histidine kinase n=1 Tax=Natrarchaeobius chitinivorans TaxID=1679083 RepID=A0A3N6MQX7_NATCH|nr:PAS domain S-box protein [Natrarchaeobius chitinivorans]RQG98651.1 PAS domain S-box protein [Natrarchaeobius chitinivorans]
MSERVPAGEVELWAGDDRTALECYRALASIVDGGIVQLDVDDRIVAIDDSLLDSTGYDRDAILDEHVSRLLSPSDADRFERSVRSAGHADGTNDRRLTLSVRTADGSTVPHEVRLHPVHLDGEVRGTVAVASEVDRVDGRTETHRPTDALGPITGVLEEADVGVFVLDDEFRVEWTNDAAERYFGLDRDEVLGRDKRRVIDETVRERLADPEAFEETVCATYDDNSYVECFECRVTPGDDREERWLEHRSKPIESGPYAGGRVELYYDVSEQRRRARQLRRLNEAVTEWLAGDSRREIATTATTHIREILGLEINGIYLFDSDAKTLRAVSLSEPATRLFDDAPAFEEGEGIAWNVYDSGEPEIYADVTTAPDVFNPETPIRSEICLPIGDHGVVLVGSRERGAFDEGDLSLAKIAASSLAVTFDRIRHEETIERERAQTEQLFRTAPVAITVEDADGRTVRANDRARELLADAAFESSLSPSERVRRTGTAVFDEELVLEDATGGRSWVSMNSAPVFDADGSIERVITVGEDVTALKEHERRLERRKAELQTELGEIFGRVSDAFYAVDDDWNVTHVNERAAEIVGRSEADVLGRNLWDVHPGAETGPFRDAFERAMDEQVHVSFETYVASLDAWLEFDAYPSDTGLSVYFRDRTERKTRERELLTYETIVETVEDGIYVIDENDRFTSVNEAYTELTGYARDEIVDEHASLVVDEEVVQLARELAVDDAVGPTIETELETRGGDRVPIEATVTAVRAGEGDDEFERIGVVRDVTERKERQRRLEESEERYRTLAENFPNGLVALFDDELRYTAAGGQLAGELEIDRREAIGQTIHERYPDDLAGEIEPHFRAALAGEERAFEVTDHGRHFSAHTLPVRTDGDDPVGMLVLQDVTERREYERRLEESNERLEQFAYAASHDLQEPLRMISSYLQLLERRYGDRLDDDGREFLGFAVDGAERMRSMIDGLLAYSRVETQGQPLEATDLEAVLESVLEDLQVSIDEHEAEVAVDSLPRVEGDASQLRQVFQNLIGNAIEYSGDEPPRVSVDAAKNGDREWVISVRDEGIGIDPDDIERVFDVFQRLHTHDEHPGTGIGLALCERIVERHGGEIWIDAEPGEGTTVSFTLQSADRRRT